MKIITIIQNDDTIIVSNGNETEVKTTFDSSMDDERERLLFALANYLGYNTTEVLNWDELECYKLIEEDEEEDESEDLLLPDEEMIEFWINTLLKTNNKNTIKDLTIEEIRKEKEEVKATIKNEIVALNGGSENAIQNIVNYEHYWAVLNVFEANAEFRLLWDKGIK